MTNLTAERSLSRRATSLASPNEKHARVDFINFKNGRMVDQGGYELDITTAQSITAARIICGTYGYDKTSVEAEGVIIAVVSK